MTNTEPTNRVYLRGLVEQTPDVRYLGHKQVVVTFRLQTQEATPTIQDPEHTSIISHNIYAWGSMAEYLEQEVRQGQVLRLLGRLSYRKDVDDTGITRLVPAIECLRFEVISSSGVSSSSEEEIDEVTDWSRYSASEEEDPMA